MISNTTDDGSPLDTGVVSVHIADVGGRRALAALAAPRRGVRVPGLRHHDIGLAAQLGPSKVPHPSTKRLVLIAFWESDAAVDAARTCGLLRPFGEGFEMRLVVGRAHGTWPGLAPGTPTARTIRSTDTAAVVLTLGRLRGRRALDFFATSAPAEAQVLAADGLIWATGIGAPPFVGTCSIWRDEAAVVAYAYRDVTAPHGRAMARDRDDRFHHQATFIRGTPYRCVGEIGEPNPLTSRWFDRTAPAPSRR